MAPKTPAKVDSAQGPPVERAAGPQPAWPNGSALQSGLIIGIASALGLALVLAIALIWRRIHRSKERKALQLAAILPKYSSNAANAR